MPIECGRRQILTGNEQCQDCDLYTKPQNNGKNCAPDPCSKRHYLDRDGTCNPCFDYTRATTNGKDCSPDNCRTGFKLLIDGTCEACKPGFRVAQDKKTCVEILCNNQILRNGACMDCPPYQHMQDKYSCKQDNCGERESLLISGYCAPCGPYTRA